MLNTLREIRARLLAPVRLSGWAAATLICGISGPFQTLEVFGPVANVFFWFGAIVVASLLAVSIDQIMRDIWPKLKWYFRLPLQAMMFAPLYAVVILLAEQWLFPADKRHQIVVWELIVEVALIYLAIVVLSHIAQARNARVEAAVFLKRVPPKLGKNLLRVSSQDHYLEITTDKGSDRILMRFSDALDELSAMDGLRVHRSHWVMKSAIQEVKQAGGKVVLHLNDGSEVPVSRTYRKDLEAVGLL